ncbi:hypothetical protein ABMA27_001342 [Loxostege sticticalis]|uniref:FLYWCH-type domain-containing protein n=1 Tax=Loxostege sticticalis TaxID=481309 RepID=A0ABR3HY92_LOXSC
MTERGAPVVYFNSYKFNKHRETGVKTRWWCSTHRGRGCSASITTIGDKYNSILDAIFTTTSRGARIIYIAGYKFFRHRQSQRKTRWFCGTHHHLGCKAVVFTVDPDTVIKCRNQHNHPPKVPACQFSV